MFRRLAILGLLVVASGPVALSAQSPSPAPSPPGGPGYSSSRSSSGTMPISSSVMATYLIRNAGAGDVMELLVLWRGTPGWIVKGNQSGSSGGGGGTTWNHRFHQGGLDFELTADLATRTLQVLGRTVDLQSANTILIDDVDVAGGGRIIRTLKVDARLDDDRTPARVLPVLGRSKDVREYLRCDVPLPDPKYQAALGSVCARILAVTPE